MSVEGEVASEEAHELHRALGPVQLISLGIGAIIGAGIFVITGHAAAAYAGPGVVISFIVAGLGCLFAGGESPLLGVRREWTVRHPLGIKLSVTKTKELAVHGHAHQGGYGCSHLD